jgi:hypothetical protein
MIRRRFSMSGCGSGRTTVPGKRALQRLDGSARVGGGIDADEEGLRGDLEALGGEAPGHLKVDHGPLAGRDRRVQRAGAQHQPADHPQPLRRLPRGQGDGHGVPDLLAQLTQGLGAEGDLTGSHRFSALEHLERHGALARLDGDELDSFAVNEQLLGGHSGVAVDARGGVQHPSRSSGLRGSGKAAYRHVPGPAVGRRGADQPGQAGPKDADGGERAHGRGRTGDRRSDRDGGPAPPGFQRQPCPGHGSRRQPGRRQCAGHPRGSLGPDRLS